MQIRRNLKELINDKSIVLFTRQSEPLFLCQKFIVVRVVQLSTPTNTINIQIATDMKKFR